MKNYQAHMIFYAWKYLSGTSFAFAVLEVDLLTFVLFALIIVLFCQNLQVCLINSWHFKITLVEYECDCLFGKFDPRKRNIHSAKLLSVHSNK